MSKESNNGSLVLQHSGMQRLRSAKLQTDPLSEPRTKLGIFTTHYAVRNLRSTLKVSGDAGAGFLMDAPRELAGYPLASDDQEARSAEGRHGSGTTASPDDARPRMPRGRVLAMHMADPGMGQRSEGAASASTTASRCTDHYFAPAKVTNAADFSQRPRRSIAGQGAQPR